MLRQSTRNILNSCDQASHLPELTEVAIPLVIYYDAFSYRSGAPT